MWEAYLKIPMNDFLLIKSALSGVVFSVPIFAIGWFLVKHRLISGAIAKWIIYPLGGGVFAFFLFGYTFPSLNPLSRLLVTGIVWAASMAMSLIIARV